MLPHSNEKHTVPAPQTSEVTPTPDSKTDAPTAATIPQEKDATDKNAEASPDPSEDNRNSLKHQRDQTTSDLADNTIKTTSSKTAYLLSLGKDNQGYAECVERVMTAEKCLTSLGYNVVGAFTSAQVTTTPIHNDGTHWDKYDKMLKEGEVYDCKWIKMAPRHLTARSDYEFLQKIKVEMRATKDHDECCYFSVYICLCLLRFSLFYNLLQRLIKVCGEVRAAPTEKEEIQFLCTVCSKLKESPYLVNFFLEVR